MRVTRQEILAENCCPEGLSWFDETFPDGRTPEITKEGVIDLLKKDAVFGDGIFAWAVANRFLDGDLRGADFSGLTLSGIDFNSTDLENANFSGCVLEECELDSCDLRGADFTRVKMQGGSIYDSDVEGANFENAYFEKTWLEYTELTQAILKNTKFNECNLGGTGLPNGKRKLRVTGRSS